MAFPCDVTAGPGAPLPGAAEKGERREERARKRAGFISNSFTFTKKLLGDKQSGNHMCSTAEANTFLHNTLSDPERDQELGPQRALISPQAPAVEFVRREPS